jgi:lysophospholipase L1-like esterase
MERSIKRSPSRIADFAIAGSIVMLSMTVSPIGVGLVTGKVHFGLRALVLSLTFAIFLLIVAGAVSTRGRMRVLLFYLLTLSFPIVALAGMEAAAGAFNLAHRIAPLGDLSTLVNKSSWPAHFMSSERWGEKDGLLLYRPWRNHDIVINELGLRTAPPTPRQSGEWRIAITGGSVTFGWRMRDVDTIPVQVQRILRERGLSNVTIYNFGIDGFVVADELAVLKRFQKLYDIDQVIFLTGSNDVMFTYMSVESHSDKLGGLANNQFELLKLVGLLKARQASSRLLQKLDSELLPSVARHNSLLEGLSSADEYCRVSALRCNFVLQPVLLTRKVRIGSEIGIARTLNQVWPRYDELFATMYRTAATAGLLVEDSSDVFDHSTEAYFIDAVHLNEAGNRRLAARIADIATPRIPGVH